MTNDQLDNIYKGLKQNEYLKIRVKKAEQTLADAESVIHNQQSIIAKQNDLIIAKDEYLENQKFLFSQELEIKNVEIKRLEDVAIEMKAIHKRENRKQLWKGIKIGGITVGVLGAATAIYLITK